MNDLYQDQIEIENYLNNFSEVPYLRNFFKEQGAEEFLTTRGIPTKFGIDLLVQIALHKRTDIGTMVGILRHHCDSAQDCSDLIEKAVDRGVVSWDAQTEKLVVAFDFTEEVQHNMERFQFPLPMLIEPEEVRTNKQTGYLTQTGSIISGGVYHNEDVCLDHINRVNKIPLSIDIDVVENTENVFKALQKPDLKDRAKKERALNKYNRHAKVISKLLVDKGNCFYETNKYDYRGRTYTVGYYVNSQGTEYNRACISLFNKEFVNE